MQKLRTPWIALGWIWVAVLLYLSLMPDPPQPLRFWSIDKLEHTLAYCLLMLWFCQAYARRTQRLFAAALLVALGVVVEFLQDMSGYRYFEFADILANTTGVLLGWIWARTGLGRIGHGLESRFLK